MNRLIVLALALSVFANCSKQPAYKIEGQVADIDGKAVLSYIQPVSKAKVIDTVDVIDGRFILDGSVEDVTKATIRIIPDNGEMAQGKFYIENALLRLDLDWNSTVDQGRYGKHIEKLDVLGGVNNRFMKECDSVGKKVLQQDKYREYSNAVEELESYNQFTEYDKYRKVLDHIRETFESQMADIRKETIAATIEFVKANPDVECAAEVFSRYLSGITLDEMEDVFNNFTPKVQNCYMAQEIMEEIAALKAVLPGSIAPDFTLKTQTGEDFTLSSLRGKYVLIDFWASWCGPCRASVPHLREIYAKYKDKGFEIVGITNDVDHDDWKRAIEDDQSSWIQVADVFPEEKKKAEIISKYAAHNLPSLYLIDKDGKMVGKIEHDQLDAKLEEIFGE